MRALAPGESCVVVFGATESGSARAAVLPAAVTVLDVARGPSRRLSEAEFACTVKARAAAAGVSSQALLGCRTPVTVAHAFHSFASVGRFPDPDHEVRWVSPSGERMERVVLAQFTRGGPGTWTLEVPRCVTPAGHPFFTPLARDPGSDSGAFAAVADVA